MSSLWLVSSFSCSFFLCTHSLHFTSLGIYDLLPSNCVTMFYIIRHLIVLLMSLLCSIIRHLAPLTLQPGASYASLDRQLLNSGGSVERDLNIVPSLADSSTGNAIPETQALVAVPATSMEPLAVVPFDQKSHPEFVRRRIRRPFSVSEVEALVQAVEKLGTGRFIFFL